MKQKMEYLKVKFIVGSMTLIIGLLAASIALFQWVERIGIQHVFGDYSRYVLGYGGFAAMILGAMLINDAWVLRGVLKGKYEVSNPSLDNKSTPVNEKKRKRRKIRGIAVLSSIMFLYMLSPVAFSLLSYFSTANITVRPIYYLHRTDVSGVTPAGKLMSIIRSPTNQSETTYNILRGGSVYFYTPTLSAESIENATWTLYIWASTASSGKSSKLTVEICLVSSDGSTVKATIGTITDVVINYGYSERIVSISGSAVTVASGDRIRLKLLAQTGAENDPSGMIFYYDGYGSYESVSHETRLRPP